MTIPRAMACAAAILLACSGCDQDGSTYGDTTVDQVNDPGWDAGGDTSWDPLSDDPGDPLADTGDDTGGPDVGDDTPAGCVPTLASTSHFTTVAEFMEFINTQRRNYGGEGGYGRHDRYKGIPWEGTYHTDTTFPNAFPWDDALASRAQEEACRLADGGAVQGVRVNGQSPEQRPFWIHGINTADWMISCQEFAGDWDDISPPFVTDKRFGLHQSNGSSRLGLHYHDFGGDGPAINLVGAGASDAGDGTTWWVLQFGP
jgi:hypothetical protein